LTNANIHRRTRSAALPVTGQNSGPPPETPVSWNEGLGVRRSWLPAIMLLAIVLLSARTIFGQGVLALSAGIASGGSPWILTLTAPEDSQPAGIQWTVTYSPRDIRSISAAAAGSAVAADKAINCAAGTGTYTCLVTGQDSAPIQDGVVAVVNVTLAAGVSSTALGLTNTLSVLPSGYSLPLTGLTAPLPTVSKITNAASFVTARAIAPGEMITLFATDSEHPIGPSTSVGLTLDSTGKVLTTIGGVQVLAAGFPCPILFASATQVSAVVPYELAGFVSSGADVLLKYLGQTSNTFHVDLATTAPGLFTANSSGAGPGAILNSDNSVNSPGNPAAKGDTVVVYLTGEGQTAPAGVTGKVTTVSTTGPLTPMPVLPISVLIGPAGAQQAANFIFAGEAPGFVSGVMQLNVRIPATVDSGDLPIVVSIGPNSSQPDVAVSIK
jgi:uncharacterized protein (TIGR03437 family)